MPIINLTRQTTLASYVQVADNPFTRMKGLLGKQTFAKGYALLIKPCTSIHMYFMKFPIDVLFLDKDNKIIGLVMQIQPFKCSPIFWKSSCAIELPAGTIESTQTQLGDQLSVSSAW